MNDHSRIDDNWSDAAGECWTARGGGIYNTGSLIMRGQARINDNGRADTWTVVQGGGVYNGKGGILSGVLCGGTVANVYGNTPDDCYSAN